MIKFKLLVAAIFTAAFATGASLGEKAKDSVDKIVLTKENHVSLRTGVNDESISTLISDLVPLLEKSQGKTPIYIVLDTPGGSVLAGFRLYEFLKSYKNVHTITLNSYSMGAILVELIDGDRLITETGTIMFHRMRITLPPNQKVDELKSSVEYFVALEQFVTEKVSERTGISKEQLTREFDSELYMSSKAAISRNFVDKVVSVECSSALIKEKVKHQIIIMPMLPPLEVEVSACPLM